MQMNLSKTIFCALIIAFGVLWTVGCKKKVPEAPSETRTVLGTEVTVTIYDQGHADAEVKAAFDDAFKLMADWEKKVLKPGAENQVAKISTGAGEQSVTTDADVFQLLMKAIRLYDTSGKVFDIRYGPMLDAWGFGAKPHVPAQAQLDTLKAYVSEGGMFVAGSGILLAKPGMRFDVREMAVGYAFDVAAGNLAQKGFKTTAISSPYVWRLTGEPPDTRGFPISLRHPVRGDSAWATAWVPAGGAAYAAVSKDRFESGGKSYHSLLDPRNGMPADKCLGSIVQTSDATSAQAMAYAAFVWGGTDSLDATGKQAVGGNAIMSGDAANPQVKATGSLAGKIETGK